MNRSAWQITLDTQYALLFRELKTRFGAKRLGYFWAIAEPAGQVLLISILFMMIGRNSLTGVSVMVFMLTGFLPYGMFRKMLSSTGAAVTANKGLLGYRQVSPMDAVAVRFTIEFATSVCVYVILLAIFGWLGIEILSHLQIDVIPDRLLEVFCSFLLLALLGSGIGLIIAVGTSYWADLQNIVSIALRPMIFISGVFYTITAIPERYWYLLTWNPVLHAIELGRDAFFDTYSTPVGSWWYLGGCTFGFLTIGLMMYRVSRNRLKVS